MPRHRDARGTFMETYNEDTFFELGLPTHWAQDNISESKEGVIRGMHLQHYKPQGKLIHCLKGMIQDVVIDCRKGPQFGTQYSVKLSSDSEHRELFWVPPGFAHGFMAIEDSLISYKCTTVYDKESETGINPLASGIQWDVSPEYQILISNKDRLLPSWIDYSKACG